MSHKYGLIGQKLSHSFSKKYFNDKFKLEDLNDFYYDNYEFKSIQEAGIFLKETDCLGLNVTIPFKESIIPYLDELDEASERISAVNTIKRYSDGKLKGFNTDYLGFYESLQEWNLNTHKKALILGSGGAAKAVAYALDLYGIEWQTVSREPAEGKISYLDLNGQLLIAVELIINCTPLGMHPNKDNSPPIPFQLLNSSHKVYDLIYNPAKTQLMEKAEAQGAMVRNGLQMLELQAEAAWKIWNDPTI